MSTPRDLILVDRAKQALAEATSIDEIKEVIDKAEALRLYFRKATEGLEIQNRAAEIKLRAERRAGELLQEIQRERRGGDRRSKSHGGTLKLSDLGINKNQSSRWQQIAGIAEDAFEEHITTCTGSGRELTSSAALKLARQLSAQATVKQPSSNGKSTRHAIDSLDELVGVKSFQCIYADPPWPYDNQGTRAATDNHYATMTLESIAHLPVNRLVAKNAHLHLWTTNAFLPAAFSLISDWGFTYKSCLLWVKPKIGLGNYWRVSHEFLLLGVRGSLGFSNRSQRSWVEADRLAHSQKPEVFRELIEQVSPGPYLELFGRKTVPGWTVWGNQVR